jgi:hypothetical protein
MTCQSKCRLCDTRGFQCSCRSICQCQLCMARSMDLARLPTHQHRLCSRHLLPLPSLRTHQISICQAIVVHSRSRTIHVPLRCSRSTLGGVHAAIVVCTGVPVSPLGGRMIHVAIPMEDRRPKPALISDFVVHVTWKRRVEVSVVRQSSADGDRHVCAVQKPGRQTRRLPVADRLMMSALWHWVAERPILYVARLIIECCRGRRCKISIVTISLRTFEAGRDLTIHMVPVGDHMPPLTASTVVRPLHRHRLRPIHLVWPMRSDTILVS